jgi:hypothetical protein
MKTLTIKDVNKAYSDVIANYLNDGWVVFAPTMSGSQGEIAFVDLQKDDGIVRVRLEKNHGYGSNIKSIELIVGYYEYTNNFGYNMCNDTLWNDKGKVIYKKVFYDVSKEYKAFTLDKDFAYECSCKHYHRFYDDKFESYLIPLSKENKIKVYNYVKTLKGYKSIRVNDIVDVVRNETRYIIHVDNREYCVSVNFPKKVENRG